MTAAVPRDRPTMEASAALGEHASEMPWWTGLIGAGAMVLLAAFSVMQLRPEHRLVAALVLAVGVLPWVAGLVLDLGNHQAWHALITIGALAVVNVGAPAWDWLEPGSAHQMSLFIGVWLVGQVTSLGTFRAGVVAWLGMAAVVLGRQVTDEWFDATAVWLAGLTVAFMAGLLIRLLGRTIIELRATQAELAREAVDAERRRIARDVHDVVAHSLSVTMLHLTAARLAVQRDDRDAAVEALVEAERAGRASLADVRRTVGLLREPGPPSPTDAVAASLPSAHDLAALVSSCQGAGMDVELDVRADLAALGPAVGLAVYRITQEALSNAARHLPGGRTRVALDVAGDDIVLDVDSTGLAPVTASVGAVTGMGLRGMQERAGALGGSVDAGPTEHGWRVVAVLPLDRTPLDRTPLDQSAPDPLGGAEE